MGLENKLPGTSYVDYKYIDLKLFKAVTTYVLLEITWRQPPSLTADWFPRRPNRTGPAPALAVAATPIAGPSAEDQSTGGPVTVIGKSITGIVCHVESDRQ